MLLFSGLALAQGARAIAQAGVQQLFASARVVGACLSCNQQFAGLSTCLQQQQQQQHWMLPQQQQHWLQQQQPQQQQLHLQSLQQMPLLSLRQLSSSTAAAAADGSPYVSKPPQQQQQQQQQLELHNPPELDALLQVLLQPVQNVHKWNAELSPYLLKVNGQLLYQPSAVLLSLMRALHVIRGMLQEDAHVYVVENNKLLRPLLERASKSCINPNMWFMKQGWAPGTLANYASSKRLFKESHQPNRRLFAAKGYKMVNPLCPRPPGAAAALPRLSWNDKWLLYKRTRKPGYRQLLEELLEHEDHLHKYRAAGSLRGTTKDLRLCVFLDSTRNQVAIKEAYLRNIPTVAIVNSVNEMKYVTYPVLARDFHPGFVHFFLDWIVKIANAAPNKAPEIHDQLSGKMLNKKAAQ